MNKKEEYYDFIKYSLPTALLTVLDRYEGNLLFKDAYKEQIQLANTLNNMFKGKILVEKRYFLNDIGLLYNFRDKMLPTKNPEQDL